MDYKTILFAGEKLALVVRPHPVVLVRPVLWPLAALALFVAAPNRVFFVLFLVALTRFAWQFWQWWVHRYVLTTDRLVATSGLITRRVQAMPLGKITDLQYTRSAPGRLLGYGSLYVESAGQFDLGHVDFIPEPDYFYRAVMSLALGPKHPGANAHKVRDALGHASEPFKGGGLPPIIPPDR